MKETVQQRTDAEREHALVQRQLRRQAQVRERRPRRFRFQFVLAAILALGAIAVYTAELTGWWTYLATAALLLMSACVLIA